MVGKLRFEGRTNCLPSWASGEVGRRRLGVESRLLWPRSCNEQHQKRRLLAKKRPVDLVCRCFAALRPVRRRARLSLGECVCERVSCAPCAKDCRARSVRLAKRRARFAQRMLLCVCETRSQGNTLDGNFFSVRAGECWLRAPPARSQPQALGTGRSAAAPQGSPLATRRSPAAPNGARPLGGVAWWCKRRQQWSQGPEGGPGAQPGAGGSPGGRSATPAGVQWLCCHTGARGRAAVGPWGRGAVRKRRGGGRAPQHKPQKQKQSQKWRQRQRPTAKWWARPDGARSHDCVSPAARASSRPPGPIGALDVAHSVAVRLLPLPLPRSQKQRQREPVESTNASLWSQGIRTRVAPPFLLINEPAISVSKKQRHRHRHELMMIIIIVEGAADEVMVTGTFPLLNGRPLYYASGQKRKKK